jgi:bifunctional non-homologous end joining protein LigD
MSIRHFGSYSVEVKREEKVFFPHAGISKGDLLAYYESVSPWILPHLRGRPLTLQRFPDGIDEEGFYQKNLPDYFPDWIDRTRVDLREGGSQTQVVASNTATLVYLANQGMVTPHVWLSRSNEPHSPDRMVFDLDPSGDDYDPVRKGAQVLRDRLEKIGLHAFFMTTGSSGGHVWVPLRRGPGFDAVRSLAAELAKDVAAVFPDQFSTEVRKEARDGKLFLDVGRNAYGQTAVAPYAVRARAGAPVASPLDWDELDDPEMTSRRYDISSVRNRLSKEGDPWKGMGRRATSLSRARRAWDKLQGREEEDDE